MNSAGSEVSELYAARVAPWVRLLALIEARLHCEPMEAAQSLAEGAGLGATDTLLLLAAAVERAEAADAARAVANVCN